jgi:serralysin
MPLSAQEQYLLELINRGRLNPAAEAARYGIDLNASLAAGTITTAAKQALAPNALLEQAAIKHSLWMLATDIFSHTGANGSTVGSRATAEGYSWNLVAENIAVWGTTGTVNLTAAIDEHHRGLFLSAGHRTNLMNSTLSEIGLAQETDRFRFTSTGPEYNASMLTEMFGHTNGKRFLTGVAFNDASGDQFYSVGEGIANVSFSVGALTSASQAAGGYAVQSFATGYAQIAGSLGTNGFTAVVDFSIGNVKLDLMNGNTFLTSSSVQLLTGVHNVTLLGNAGLFVTGNDANNVISGNDGANPLSGWAGNDAIHGNAGQDLLFGGAGNDWLTGGTESDTLNGGDGDDILVGNRASDLLTGGLGSDQFVFRNGDGLDRVLDFSVAQRDQLLIDNDLWVGTLTPNWVVANHAWVTEGSVVLNFGQGDLFWIHGTTNLWDVVQAITII